MVGGYCEFVFKKFIFIYLLFSLSINKLYIENTNEIDFSINEEEIEKRISHIDKAVSKMTDQLNNQPILKAGGAWWEVIVWIYLLIMLCCLYVYNLLMIIDWLLMQ
jgi:hypothetical protein